MADRTTTSYAATDIGSNATKTMIWQIGADRRPLVICQKRWPLRISGAFRTEIIDPATIDKLAGTFREIALACSTRNVGEHQAVATDAFRVARNSDQAVETVRKESGVRPRVLSTEEEGRLVSRGVLLDIPEPDGELMILDVGGGSAEAILTNGNAEASTLSLPLGAVRLRETFVRRDPIAPQEFEEMRDHVERTVAKRIAPTSGRWTQAVGVGGGVRFLHTMYGVFRATHMQDQPLRTDQLEHLTQTIWPLKVDTLVRNFGIDRERAEIIVPGAVVLLALMKRLGLSSIRPSWRGVRDGMLAEFIDSLS